MTLVDIRRFRKILEAKQAELSGLLRNRDEIAIEKAADALDEVQQMGERELAIRYLDLDSSLLQMIRRALARIADGSFGVCLHCEDDVSPKRLAAVPWADFCIKCQERADRHEISATSTGADGDGGLLSAVHAVVGARKKVVAAFPPVPFDDAD